MTAKVITFGALLVLIAVSVGIAAEAEHDGQWWRAQARAEKLRYAARLFDGQTVGANLLEFGMSAQVLVRPDTPARQIAAAQKPVRFDGGELVGNIDRFYTDPRNMTIPVSKATVVFLQSAAGASRDALKRMTEEYRKPGC